MNQFKLTQHGDFQLKSATTRWMQRMEGGEEREREREGYRVRYGATVRGRATQHPNKECKTKQRLQRWQDAGWI